MRQCPMDTPLNVEHYKTRLLELETSMSVRAERAMAAGRGEFIDIAHDSGDASVANEVAAEKFTEAEMDSHTCLLYTSPSPRDGLLSRMPSSA